MARPEVRRKKSQGRIVYLKNVLDRQSKIGLEKKESFIMRAREKSIFIYQVRSKELWAKKLDFTQARWPPALPIPPPFIAQKDPLTLRSYFQEI